MTSHKANPYSNLHAAVVEYLHKALFLITNIKTTHIPYPLAITIHSPFMFNPQELKKCKYL